MVRRIQNENQAIGAGFQQHAEYNSLWASNRRRWGCLLSKQRLTRSPGQNHLPDDQDMEQEEEKADCEPSPTNLIPQIPPLLGFEGSLHAVPDAQWVREMSEVVQLRLKTTVQKAFNVGETIKGLVSVPIERQVGCPEPE